MSEHRLPSASAPNAYRIHITADPAEPTFTGVVEIDVHAAGAIEMHGEVDVQRITVDGAEVEFAKTGDRLSLAGAHNGDVLVRIEYTGTVRHDMAGLYLSKDGERSCLATQCEATDARSIVPCWDEPSYKATWQWTITAPAALTVLANGPEESCQVHGALATRTFAATGPMSSYLIAFCVGDFASSTEVVARDTPFRVWATKGQEQHGGPGNEIAARMLPWYEDYFGQPYAFGKYDQIAVPSFAFGAMENAGLVLFRPSLLLLDESTASWDDRRHVALVVAHEFAHMWFGNLVTMAWWDDLWLNEAFAEWIAHKCADAMDESLDVWVPFRQRAAGALSTDALDSTHAIYHPVKTPEEAQEMFDAITYGKGSAVMRMLESFLGEDAFRAGLQTYMAENKFDNAQGQDLWKHLGAASGQDVAGIMGDWVKQAGHPTIYANFDGKLQLRQARTRSSPTSPEHDTTWRVPLVIRYADERGVHEHRHLMAGATETVDLHVQGQLKWLWPNANDGGFYRCALDGTLLPMALEQYEHLSAPEQVALLRDQWMQVRSGALDIHAFLESVAASLGDHGYEVVEFQIGLLRMLDGLLHGSEEQAAYRQWLGLGLRPMWADDRDATEAGRQRRAAILRGLGTAGDGVGLAAATELAAADRAGQDVDVQLAGAAVQAEALNGDLEKLQLFLDTYEARRAGDASPQEVERYLYSLASFRDPACIARVLELLAAQGVAAQAEGPILRALLSSAHGGSAAWAHLKKDWPELEGRLGEAWLGIIVEACGELPVELAPEVIAFWDEHINGRAGQSYMRAKERLQERAELEGRILPELRVWAEGLAALTV